MQFSKNQNPDCELQMCNLQINLMIRILFAHAQLLISIIYEYC